MTQNEYSVSSSAVLQAPPEEIFDVLADPRKHPLIDGSGMLREGISGPDRLELGSRFGMRMHKGVGYRITNRVVEYEENRLIAWGHFAPQRWRYELEPAGEGATKVTETFDYSRMPLPPLLRRLGLPRRSQAAMRRTLERLKHLVEQAPAE